eukprot:890704-Pelagomonas_calceolata.AAC.1
MLEFHSPWGEPAERTGEMQHQLTLPVDAAPANTCVCSTYYVQTLPLMQHQLHQLVRACVQTLPVDAAPADTCVCTDTSIDAAPAGMCVCTDTSS